MELDCQQFAQQEWLKAFRRASQVIIQVGRFASAPRFLK
jgi:hypothetical protein